MSNQNVAVILEQISRDIEKLQRMPRIFVDACINVYAAKEGSTNHLCLDFLHDAKKKFCDFSQVLERQMSEKCDAKLGIIVDGVTYKRSPKNPEVRNPNAAAVLWQLIPHIANPNEVLISVFDVLISAIDPPPYSKDQKENIGFLLEIMSNFRDALDTLRKEISSKIELDTEATVADVIYRRADSPMISYEVDYLNGVEHLKVEGEKCLGTIFGYQIDHLNTLITKAEEIRTSP